MDKKRDIFDSTKITIIKDTQVFQGLLPFFSPSIIYTYWG